MPEPERIRKRKRPEGERASGSSSDEDEPDDRLQKDDEHDGDADAAAAAPVAEGDSKEGRPQSLDTGTPSPQSPSSSSSSPPPPRPPPPPKGDDGWRVKLYRLNVDGSWDDCGTGRITCVYRRLPRGGGASSPSSPPDDTEGGRAPHPDQWLYQETGEATLVVTAEPAGSGGAAGAAPADGNKTSSGAPPRILLRTRILLRDAYQRQGENIITWCEPYFSPAAKNKPPALTTNGNSGASNPTAKTTGVDLALSFQDNEGCLDIWHQISQVQSRAADMIQSRSVEDLAAQVAAQHHADLCQQQERNTFLWNNPGGNNDANGNGSPVGDRSDADGVATAAATASALRHVAWASAAAELSGNMSSSLPRPPTLANLEDVADGIATLQHVQQRDNLAQFIAQDDCAYLKEMLALFPEAEAKDDYEKLATLAACVKAILLLNEPSILELIVSVGSMFEQVCSCLEYDPDLREKANHRWFLRERARFRTVVPMDDPELVGAIHRCFRVNYLKDTLLRPTMDESSLSTLTSLQTFTHADVVKGVTMAPGTELEGGSLYDSYLVRVLDTLCMELHAISIIEWAHLESGGSEEFEKKPFGIDPSIVFDKQGIGASHTKQYLAPQDGSLGSRKIRRRGCLLFLKELFNMVRMSLQQNDKDEFFSIICTLDIDLNEARELADNVSQTSQQVEVGSVASTVKSDRLDDKPEQPVNFESHSLPPRTNLLSMLGNALADPGTDPAEKSAVLDILVGVAMHDPSLIRRHCLEFHADRQKRLEEKLDGFKDVSSRPEPNERNQVLFICAPNDLMMSLLFAVAVEADVGILLQVSEILRIVLDTDMMNDSGPINGGFSDEAPGISIGHVGPSLQPISQNTQQHLGSPGAMHGFDEKQFLSTFYEHYVEWLVAPFQFHIMYPARPVPENVLWDSSQSELLQQKVFAPFRKGLSPNESLVVSVSDCSIRSSFAVELLSFCVRAHTYRMKFFLLRSKVIASVLKFLRSYRGKGISNSRSLKLAVLRFLRAILSANDEFYHRHIIQNDLFAAVFEALRTNPVGDNLLSSAIVEMCDYIHSENIMSLIEYIFNNHLDIDKGPNRSVEDVSSPYANTMTILRQAYEASLNKLKQPEIQPHSSKTENNEEPQSPRVHNVRHLSGRALEDQRKFRELDEEESYFDSDDGFDQTGSLKRSSLSYGQDVAQDQIIENELHRTPRMFLLAQTQLLQDCDSPKGQMSPKESPSPLRDDDDLSDQSPPTIDRIDK